MPGERDKEPVAVVDKMLRRRSLREVEPAAAEPADPHRHRAQDRGLPLAQHGSAPVVVGVVAPVRINFSFIR